MKLIWHIIKYDILRERWGLLVWALFFVGQDAVGVVARNYTGINAEWAVGLQVTNVVLNFLQVTMGYVLVARLVQTDALVGTSVFWRTRPISAGRLLAAKLLGALLLFALLPVLLLLPWWLYCQFGWREILWSTVEILGWQLLMIAPAFLVASLTDDLGRVLLWTLLLLIGLMSWIALMQSSLMSSFRGSGQASGSFMFTRLWVSSLVLIGGSLLVGAHQYLTRRFVRSVGLVVLCLGLVALAGRVWPWNFGRTIASLHNPSLRPVDPALVDHLSFAVETAKGEFGGGLKEKDVGKREAALHVRLRVGGLPEDLGIIAGDSISHTWSWGDGLKLERASGYLWSDRQPANAILRRTYSLPAWEEDAETTRWRKVRRDKLEANRLARGGQVFRWEDSASATLGVGETMLRGYVNVPNSFLAKMKAEAPAYRTEARWILHRPVVIAELPLKEDVRASGQAQTLHLRRMNGNKPLVISTRSSVTLFGLWYSSTVVSEFRSWFYRERFLLVNRVKGDISEVREGQTGLPNLLVGGVLVIWNVVQVEPRPMIRNDQDVVADPQWLDHSVLVLVGDKDVAQFDHTVETAKFELEPDRTSKASASAGP